MVSNIWCIDLVPTNAGDGTSPDVCVVTVVENHSIVQRGARDRILEDSILILYSSNPQLKCTVALPPTVCLHSTITVPDLCILGSAVEGSFDESESDQGREAQPQVVKRWMSGLNPRGEWNNFFFLSSFFR